MVEHDNEPITIPSNLSSTGLENKGKQLRELAAQTSAVLTQKLASSQSGQNLLHMGSSLSTLPPVVHSLLQQLHPLLAAVEQTESDQVNAINELYEKALAIRQAQRRSQHAIDCSIAYQDLVAAEKVIQRDTHHRRHGTYRIASDSNDEGKEVDDSQDDVEDYDELDHTSSLERAAHITLCLLAELQGATETISTLTQANRNNENSEIRMPSLHTPLQPDSERAEFLLQLAPRIRRLESDTVACLSQRFENFLKANEEERKSQSSLLLIGHCIRGLAILGRGSDVESIFARVAIMPIVRPFVSMGRLDQGGARAECAGLPSLLEEMLDAISGEYGHVLCLTEAMFVDGSPVDLLTAGVWVPIATAFLADAAVKMAIFSPGIAHVLQSNYLALEGFVSRIAERLLQIQYPEPTDDANGAYFKPLLTADNIAQAQERIYRHSKTKEYTKKWNLPIYYQLRFGECCKRLNSAIETTRAEGWVAEVYTGTEDLKALYGFELGLFQELYDILLFLWKPDVILMPLANRFLRGALQLVGRTVSFISDGMDGAISFGEMPVPSDQNGENGTIETSPLPRSYCWGDSEDSVAAVTWELHLLCNVLHNQYAKTVCAALTPSHKDLSHEEAHEISELVKETLQDASQQIIPVVENAWNKVVVKNLTEKCSAPLAAVKGVAATYRMTNRPPPTQASPFVATILRPLQNFLSEFSSRTPEHVGLRWKQDIVVTVSDRYATAVEELISTVQRTEVALQRQNTRNRRARLAAAGVMSDGEKVKLQLFLDYVAFLKNLEEIGVNPKSVPGVSKLEDLTKEGSSLQHGHVSDQPIDSMETPTS